MTMTLSGDGTITGLVAGGLPNATVQTADLVDGAVTAAKLSGAQTGSAPIYGARAWAVWNGGTTGTNAPTAGGNVSTIQRTAAGTYIVTMTTAMPDTDYSICGSTNTDGDGKCVVSEGTAARTTTTFEIVVSVSGGASAQVDQTRVSLVVFR